MNSYDSMYDNYYVTEDARPIENPGERHAAVAIVADNSGSMAGRPVEELYESINAFVNAVMDDTHAQGIVDALLITFDSNARVETPFAPISQFEPPPMRASGTTAMNQAIILALEELKKRRQFYRANRTPHFVPWIFLITDGYATDNAFAAQAQSMLDEDIRNRKVLFFPVGVGNDADITALGTLNREGGGTVLRGDYDSFRNAFQWLSASMVSVANSRPGETLRLPAPENDATPGATGNIEFITIKT